MRASETPRDDYDLRHSANPLDHFWAIKGRNKFLNIAWGGLWSARGVNHSVGKIDGELATVWLRKNKVVDAYVYAPGEPSFIKDKLPLYSHWKLAPGALVYNFHPHRPSFYDQRNREGRHG